MWHTETSFLVLSLLVLRSSYLCSLLTLTLSDILQSSLTLFDSLYSPSAYLHALLRPPSYLVYSSEILFILILVNQPLRLPVMNRSTRWVGPR